MGTLVLTLYMVVPAIAGVPGPFTGDVEVDFDPTVYEVLVIPDPSVLGPNEITIIYPPLPDPNATVHTSGWNIKDLRLAYDDAADILYVGVNSYGIIGDVDGDGDPNASFDSNQWNDYPDLSNGEAVAVYFDLDFDEPFGNTSNWDVIAGVRADGDCTNFSVSEWGGLGFNPGSNFGTPLISHYNSITPPTCPSASWHDYEFTILNFSQLADTLTLSDPNGLSQFRVGVYAGSQNDGNVGEDFIYYHQKPGTEVTITPSAFAVIDGGTVNLTVTEENDSFFAVLGQQPGPISGTTTVNLPLHDVEVDITQNGSPFITLTDPADSGDISDAGVLNMGEIWLWTIPSVPITASTEFVATGSGLDPAGFTHTFSDDPNMPGDPNERAVVDVNFLSTDVGITADPNAVECDDPFDLIVTELNDGDAPLTDVNVVVTYNNGGGPTPLVTLSGPPDSGDTIANGDLDPGETWSWTIPGLIIGATTTFTATGSAQFDSIVVTYPDDPNEQDSVTVTWSCRNPGTSLDIIPDGPITICEGETVTLTICEENTGDVDLTDPFVELYNGAVLIMILDVNSPGLTGDDGSDGILGGMPDPNTPGETWCWDVNIPDANGTYIAIGHGYTDGILVTWCIDPNTPPQGIICDQNEIDEVVVTPEPCGGQGCTPGFWKNNAKNWDASAWVGYSPNQSFSSVFGVVITIFTGGNPNKSSSYITDPTLLEALDANGGGINALARHAVAALLNTSSHCVDYSYSSVGILIADVHDAILAGDAAIQALHIKLAYDNEAGCPISQHQQGDCI